MAEVGMVSGAMPPGLSEKEQQDLRSRILAQRAYTSKMKKMSVTEKEALARQQLDQRIYGGIGVAGVTPEVMAEWLNTVKPELRDAASSALGKYFQNTFVSRDRTYLASDLHRDKAILENAGLIVGGKLGPRSLSRMLTEDPSARNLPEETQVVYRGDVGYVEQGKGNLNALFQQKQQRIYGDLLGAQKEKTEQPAAEQPAAEQPAEASTAPVSEGPPPVTSMTGPARPMGGPQEPRKLGRTVGERRRAVARYGPGKLQRYRMAGQLGGFQAISSMPMVQHRFDPYRETWWEFGKEIGGTDKAGYTWTAEDLGIQY